MKSMSHNFNLIKFATQLILHIHIWLSCVVKYIICGVEINGSNFKSGGLA